MKLKTLVLLLTVVTFSVKSYSQATGYTPWQVNLTAGYAAAAGKGTKGGIAAYLEPQYHITDNFTAGLRLGTALTAKIALDNNGEEITGGSFSVAAVASYLATGSYYFQKEPGAKFRPFAGVGLGIGRAAGVSSSTTSTTYQDDYQDKTGFSAMARAGFDISHFRMNLEYNLNPKTGRISNNYFGVMLGFYFGGGAKK